MFAIPNPFVSRPSNTEKGTLTIYPRSARIDGDVEVKGKLRIFCRFTLGAGVLVSDVDKKHDREPVWTQELAFRRENETDLLINLFDKNLVLAPTHLCECRINLSGVLSNQNVTVTPNLIKKGNVVGSMKVMLTWKPDQNFAQPVIQRAQTVSQNPMPSHQNQSQNQTHAPQVMYLPPGYNMMSAYQYAQMGNSMQARQSTFVSMNSQHGPYNQPPPPPQGFFASQMVYPSYPNGSMPQYVQPPVSNIQQPQPNQMSQQLPKPEKKQIIEESADPDTPEEQKCVICLDRKKAGAFYKCGHTCCCLTCGNDFIGKNCPICRQPVLDFIKVFDS